MLNPITDKSASAPCYHVFLELEKGTTVNRLIPVSSFLRSAWDLAFPPLFTTYFNLYL